MGSVTERSPIPASADEARSVEALEKLGATITRDYKRRQKPVLAVRLINSAEVADADLTYVATLKSLRELDLHGTPVGDAGLAHLKGLTTLQCLRAPGCAPVSFDPPSSRPALLQ